MFIAFDSLDTQLYSQYDRNDRAAALSLLSGEVSIRARVYSHYSGKMVQALVPTPTPWRVILFKIVQGKFEPVWSTLDGNTVALAFTLKTASFADGHYYLGSSERDTLMVPVLLRNGSLPLLQPDYVAVCPAYMAGEWPHPMGASAGLTEPAIIPWKGMRPARLASIALPIAAKPARRLKPNEVWWETACLATPQKAFVRYPSTTPWGGITISHQMRYQEQNFDDVNPIVAGNITALGYKNDQLRFSPTEHMDGYPSDSGHGVINSGFQTPEFHWHLLDPMGRISCFDRRRKTRTLYGWRRRPGTLHPRNIDKCPDAATKLGFLLTHYDRIGTGPEIWRAWQMCPSATEKNVVYVANTSQHTIVKIDLATGIGTTIAGQEGVAGFQDGGGLGAGDTALFDQPRGVVHLTQGAHAGKLFICDEHNSAFRLLDLKTGLTTTLAQARKVPLNPRVDLGNRPPRDIKDSTGAVLTPGIRTLWGMPGLPGSAQPFADCQFVHPCQVAEFSDGRLGVVHHDEYRISIIDLAAETITYFRDIQVDTVRTEVFPVMWPTISIDKSGAFGAVDDIFVACWQHTTLDRFGLDGSSHALTMGEYLTQGGTGQLGRQFAYPRVWLAGINGECLYNGDDASGVHVVRPKMPGDPVLDEARFARGRGVYRREVPRADGTYRAALTLSHGYGLQHYFAGMKCGPEFAWLTQAESDIYWRTYAPDLDDAQLKDLRYWCLWQSAEGIQKLREGAIV